MEAGYDYTLLGGRPRWQTWITPVLFAVILGGILVTASGVYYGFAAQVQADRSVAAVEGSGEGSPAVDGPGRPDQSANRGVGGNAGRVAPASDAAIAGQQLYPAGLSEVDYWVNPLAQEP
jgi:hypothetical protein